MINEAAEEIHRMSRQYEEMADVARKQTSMYAEGIKAAKYLGWNRFVELSQRGQALAKDMARTLDALAAESSRLAEEAETKSG